MPKLHPSVALADTIGLGSTLLGGAVIVVASFAFVNLAVLVPGLVTLLIVVAVLNRLRWRQVARRAFNRRDLVMAVPAVLAGLSLVGYGAVLTWAHTHYDSRLTAQYVRVSSRYLEQLRAVNGRARTEAETAKRLESAVATSEARSEAVARQFAAQQASVARELKTHPGSVNRAIAVVRRGTGAIAKLDGVAGRAERAMLANTRQYGATLAAFVATERRFPRPPSLRRLPAWFSHLGGTFATMAPILLALLLALVFVPRRRSSSSADAALRAALLITLIGLLAATVGTLPSLSGNVQAVLFGYTLAALLGSSSAIALIASDRLRLPNT